MKKFLSEEFEERLFVRICHDIGNASMCWEHPENAGIFHSCDASKIAAELYRFVIVELEKFIQERV